MSIYTAHQGNSYSLIQSAASAAHADTADSSTSATYATQLNTARNIHITDPYGNYGANTAFDGSADIAVTLGSGITVPTIMAGEALILPENTGGPANGIFIYKANS